MTTIVPPCTVAFTGNGLANEIDGNLIGNKLDGGAGNDTLFGFGGFDTLIGGLANDILDAGEEADILLGGAGDDILEGGLGGDTLSGGAGKDVFLYELDNPGDLAALGGDTINGFTRGADKIDLRDLLSDFGVDRSDAFSGGFIFLNRIGNDTVIDFDTDGGGGVAAILATVTNATLAASDLAL
jgi:Ca2+-binding RTX toxin-like protein